MQKIKDLPYTTIVLHNRHSLSGPIPHDTTKAVEISYPRSSIGLLVSEKYLRAQLRPMVWKRILINMNDSVREEDYKCAKNHNLLKVVEKGLF